MSRRGSEMTSARDEILERVRGALSDVPASERPEDVAVVRGYRARAPGDLPARFAERVSDYRAAVSRISAAAVASEVARICRQLELRRLVVPGGLPGEWRPEGVELVVDDRLSAHELDRFDGVLTGCAVAIAETGTIVLDGRGPSGRRAITLVPDHHICVVRSEQLAGSLPEAIAGLADAVERERLPITFVSGPSATSDIELTRVEGVHGPRHLHVVLAMPARS